MLRKILGIALSIMMVASTLPMSATAQVTVTKDSSAFTMKLADWKIAPTVGDDAISSLNGIVTGSDDAVVADPAYNTGAWKAAVVPGTVLGNLIDDGVYDDLFEADSTGAKNVFFNDNMSKIVTTPFNNPWWYSTDFVLPAAENGKKININLKGISYTGEVYVNGEQVTNKNLNILSDDELKNGPTALDPTASITDVTNNAGNTSSLFRYNGASLDAYSDKFVGTMRTYDVDITDYIVADGVTANNIKIKVTRPTYSTDLTYYWVDWNPQPADTMMGLTGEIIITTSGQARLDNPAVTSKINDDLDKAQLNFYVDVSNTGGAALNASLTAVIKSPSGLPVATITKTNISIAPNVYNKEIELSYEDYPQLEIDDPELWWPYLYGDQPLYTAEYALQISGVVSDTLHHRFGIREIGAEVNVSPYANQNSQSISNSNLANMLQIYVNHKPILLKGGGYCASDIFLRHSQSTNEAVVDYVKYMGMNMIRDEGKFFDNDLLDLLDENGILLMTGWCCCDRWQSPGSWSKAERFVAFESLYSQIRNARSHASMMIWFNGSDDPPSISSTGVNGKNIEQKYFEIEAKLRWFDIGAICSSGSSIVATLTNVTGGMHMDASYDIQTPTWYYYDRQGMYGFISEGGGGASIPVLETVKRVLPEDKLWPYNAADNYNYWNYHNTRGSFSTLSQAVTFIDGSYGASADIEEFVARAQIYQYDSQRAQYEALNYNRYKNTSGFINWMLNNAWPIFFWNQFDYYMNPNGTTFGARKGNEPLHIMYDMYSKQISIINNTLEAYEDVTASLSIYDINGDLISEPLEKTLDIVPDGASAAVDYASSGSNHLGPQMVGLKLNDEGGFDKYNINYYGKIEEAYGVNTIWDYDDIQASLIKPTSDVYFIRLELKDDSGEVVSYNAYAEPMRNDVAGASHTWSRSAAYQAPDMTQLNQLPGVELETAKAAPTIIANGKVTETLDITNPSGNIAYAVELKAYTDAGKSALVAPVLYEDNLFTLFPGETRRITISHNQRDLAGEAFITVNCYNNVISGDGERAAVNIYKAIPAGGSNNLAKGKTVTGGGSSSNATAVPAAGETAAANGKTFIDSNMNSVATMSASNGPFVVNLGSVQDFDRIMLRWNAASGNNMLRGRPDSILIEISNDNVNYITAATYANTSGSVMTNIILPEQVSARYLRITPTGFIGQSPAVGVVANASSSGAGNQNASNAFNLSAIEVYAFNDTASLKVSGSGGVIVNGVTHDANDTANESLVVVKGETLDLKFVSDGTLHPLIYKDGVDVTPKRVSDSLTIADVDADAEVLVVFDAVGTYLNINPSTRISTKLRTPYQLNTSTDGTQYTYASANQGIARVDQNGLITPVRAGQTIISVRSLDGTDLISTVTVIITP
ncbi:MAG: discoidin domain-containing protein [Clostridiales Family XIII bacterium]|nr:discoidin domain-containing protein [Clostridiales Family XIII bacterium]